MKELITELESLSTRQRWLVEVVIDWLILRSKIRKAWRRLLDLLQGNTPSGGTTA